MDAQSLIQQINKKEFKPLYLLQGEEPYYIDMISKALVENVLEEHERDFNQTILYGKDADALAIVSEAKGLNP